MTEIYDIQPTAKPVSTGFSRFLPVVSVISWLCLQ